MRRSIKSALQSKWAPVAAGAIGLLEGTAVLFPLEPLFLPVMIARKSRAWVIALFLLVGNVAGAAMMYALGAWLAEPVIEPFVQFLDAADDYQQASEDLSEHGFLSLFLIGITPFPFQLGTAAAGAVGYPFGAFIVAVTLSRGLRYFALAALIMAVGASAKEFIERHEVSIFLAGIVVFVAVAVWLFIR